nr:hypothetical protein [Tanacetum cinerariifolium]
MTQLPQMDLGLAVLVFNQGDDPIVRVVKYYNCQGEGHMDRQCTQPKRPKNAACQAAQTTILNTSSFQFEDLDAYDSDCDDVSNAKAVSMVNLSNYGLNVILE